MEVIDHGTALFPISCFTGDVAKDPVLLHWHEDWELVEVLRGTVNVSVEGHLCRLEAGQGIFLNALAPHSLTGEESPAEIRSAVYHPRITGDLGSLCWQQSGRDTPSRR